MLAKIIARTLQDLFSAWFWKLVLQIVILPFLVLMLAYLFFGDNLIERLMQYADFSVTLFQREFKPFHNKIILRISGLILMVIIYWLVLIALVSNSIDFIEGKIRKHYPLVSPSGFGRGFHTMLALLGRSLKYLLGYLILMPLFFIPVLGVLLSILYSAYVLDKTLLFEAASKVLNKEEYRRMQAENNRERMFLGLLGALLNYVPLGFFFTPLIQAILYLHFAFSWKEKRGDT